MEAQNAMEAQYPKAMDAQNHQQRGAWRSGGLARLDTNRLHRRRRNNSGALRRRLLLESENVAAAKGTVARHASSARWLA
jgi:hypothetical protein